MSRRRAHASRARAHRWCGLPRALVKDVLLNNRRDVEEWVAKAKNAQVLEAHDDMGGCLRVREIRSISEIARTSCRVEGRRRGWLRAPTFFYVTSKVGAVSASNPSSPDAM